MRQVFFIIVFAVTVGLIIPHLKGREVVSTNCLPLVDPSVMSIEPNLSKDICLADDPAGTTLAALQKLPPEKRAKEPPKAKEFYLKIIEAAASTYNLPASLITAIIKVESSFDPNAISSKGAVGLMQLSMSTRKALNVKNPFDPVQNILAGAKYLRQLIDRFQGDVEMAIAAYNAGPEAVERHGGVPPYSQTRAFVPKVMDYYTRYESDTAID